MRRFGDVGKTAAGTAARIGIIVQYGGMKATHRLATLRDANRLFELRRNPSLSWNA
jgi:hypothetical protein